MHCPVLLVVLFLSLAAGGGVKIAGVEPKSRATAEGSLPAECKWEFVSETRIGKVQPPSVESRALSSGRNAEGKQQEIVLQPDGTRITLIWNDASVIVAIIYPDGSGDTLILP